MSVALVIELVPVTVTVKRERSDQRRHHRVTAPLFVTVLGETLRAADWSLGGLRIEGFKGTIPAMGAEVALKLALPFQGFDVAFDATATIVRRDDAKGMFAVMFKELGEREAGLMKHFIEELVRGAMSPVADTIQRIDVPVTPASTAPDLNPKSEVPLARWPMKTMAFTAFYLVAGIFIFGYALVLAWTNFFRMEVDSAVVTAPVETVRAQIDGRVRWGRHKPGDSVARGAIVLHVLDHELEKEIDFAHLDIAQKQAQLSALKLQLQEELARVVAFATVEQKNIEQLQHDLNSLEAAARAAKSQHDRLSVLFKQGFTTQTHVETAEKQAIAARQAAESKAVELSSRRTLAEHDSGRRLYNGQTFIGDRAKVESQVHQVEQEVAIAGRKLATLLGHRDRLAVIAPFAGILSEISRVDGAMVRKGDMIAVIEQPSAREVTAYLRQEEVLRVGLDDVATIYIPALGETRRGRVTSIDRTAGFINEQNSTYTWRGPRDRSAKVTLAFDDGGSEQARQSYRSGTPAIVIFKTRSSNYVVNDIKKRFDFLFGSSRPRPPIARKSEPPAERVEAPPFEPVPHTTRESEILSAEAVLRAADKTLPPAPSVPAPTLPPLPPKAEEAPAELRPAPVTVEPPSERVPPAVPSLVPPLPPGVLAGALPADLAFALAHGFTAEPPPQPAPLERKSAPAVEPAELAPVALLGPASRAPSTTPFLPAEPPRAPAPKPPQQRPEPSPPAAIKTAPETAPAPVAQPVPVPASPLPEPAAEPVPSEPAPPATPPAATRETVRAPTPQPPVPAPQPVEAETPPSAPTPPPAAPLAVAPAPVEPRAPRSVQKSSIAEEIEDAEAVIRSAERLLTKGADARRDTGLPDVKTRSLGPSERPVAPTAPETTGARDLAPLRAGGFAPDLAFILARAGAVDLRATDAAHERADPTRPPAPVLLTHAERVAIRKARLSGHAVKAPGPADRQAVTSPVPTEPVAPVAEPVAAGTSGDAAGARNQAAEPAFDLGATRPKTATPGRRDPQPEPEAREPARLAAALRGAVLVALVAEQTEQPMHGARPIADRRRAARLEPAPQGIAWVRVVATPTARAPERVAA